MYHQFQRAEPKKKNVRKKTIKDVLQRIFEEVCRKCSKEDQLCSDYNATRANIIKCFTTLNLPAKEEEISLTKLPLPEMEGKIKNGFLMTNIYIRFKQRITKKVGTDTVNTQTTDEPITTEGDIKNKLIFIVGLLKKHYKIQ